MEGSDGNPEASDGEESHPISREETDHDGAKTDHDETKTDHGGGEDESSDEDDLDDDSSCTSSDDTSEIEDDLDDDPPWINGYYTYENEVAFRECHLCDRIIYGTGEKLREHLQICAERMLSLHRSARPRFRRLRPTFDEDSDEDPASGKATSEKSALINLKASIRDTAHRMWKKWKLPRPDLLLFVIDVEASAEEMRDDRLKRDLCILGEKTKVLVTTMGKNRGRPALPDLECQETDRKDRGLYSIALRSLEDVSEETKEFIETGKTSAEPEVEAELGEGHSFFFTADADTQDDASQSLLPDIIEFRQRLEDELMWRGTVRLPAVYLLVGGAKTSWDYMIAALKKKIPVIVLADSGGLAHDLFELWKTAKAEEDSTDGGLRQTRLNEKNVSKDIINKFSDFTDLSLLLEKFKYIQFYSSESNDRFEDVLYKTFIQAHQEKELAELLTKTLDLATRQSGTVSASEEASGSGESKPTDTAKKVLFQALVFDCPDVVETLLNQGLNLQKDFQMSELKHLYAKVKRSSLLFKLAKSTRKVKEKITVADSRRVVHYLMQDSTYPLTCENGLKDECSCQCKGSETCCMAVCQELLLWAVLSGKGKMAEVFWKVTPERITSALIVSALFKAMQKKEKVDENTKQLLANAKRFHELAKGTLFMAYKKDAKMTRQLLLLHNVHWATITIEDLVFDFPSMEILASEAFSTKLDSLWRGDTLEDTDLKESDGKQNATKSEMVKKFCTSPRIKFLLAQLSTIAFLLLYAFVILFQTTPQQFTPAEIVLCMWVLTLAVEEVLQMFPLDDNRRARLKVKNYFKDIWNIIDFASILIFILGMILRCSDQKNWNYEGPSPDDVTEDFTTVFHLAHVLLSVDFFLFMARLLQVFCMNQSLGPMITMVFKMLKDLTIFIIILMLVCLAYAVTSHAILYPNGQTPFTLEEIFEIPSQAYWSIFGDFKFLETLQAKPVENGEVTCSNNRSVVAQGEVPFCLDPWSRYIVPVILGFYVMVANILLINLLIAIFGNTYADVKAQSEVHWRWQRFFVIREFQRRTFLPPPLNILSLLYDEAKKIHNTTGKAQVSASVMPQADPGTKKIFDWEKKISKNFVNDQKAKDDNIVNAISDVSQSQEYILSTLWSQERRIKEIREMVRAGKKSDH